MLMTFDIIQMGGEASSIDGTDWMTSKAEWWGYVGRIYTLDGCPASRRKATFITYGLRSSSVEYKVKLPRRLGVEHKIVLNAG